MADARDLGLIQMGGNRFGGIEPVKPDELTPYKSHFKQDCSETCGCQKQKPRPGEKPEPEVVPPINDPNQSNVTRARSKKARKTKPPVPPVDEVEREDAQAGKKCGKGWISADKECRTSEGKAVHQEPESYFSSEGKTYDLNPLFKAAHNKPSAPVDLADLEWQSRKGDYNADDEKRITNADLKVSVLVTHDPEGHLLMVDGDHRYEKARRMGLKQLPSKMLTPEEMKSAEVPHSKKDSNSEAEPDLSDAITTVTLKPSKAAIAKWVTLLQTQVTQWLTEGVPMAEIRDRIPSMYERLNGDELAKALSQGIQLGYLGGLGEEEANRIDAETPENHKTPAELKLMQEALAALRPRDSSGRFARGSESNQQSKAVEIASAKTLGAGMSVPILKEDPLKSHDLGQGVYGDVYLTPKGTVYKKLKVMEAYNPEETKNMSAMHKAGIAPALLAMRDDNSGFEMEFLKDHIPFGQHIGTVKGKLKIKDGSYAAALEKSLTTMHLQGLLHNDLSVNNIMCHQSGSLKLIDFGGSSQHDFEKPEESPKQERNKHLRLMREVDTAASRLKETKAKSKVAKVYLKFAKEFEDDFRYSVNDSKKVPTGMMQDYTHRFLKELRNVAT